jgi:hypothetical protein
MGSEWVQECSDGDCGLGGDGEVEIQNSICLLLPFDTGESHFLSFFLFVLKSSNDIFLFVCAGSLE